LFVFPLLLGKICQELIMVFFPPFEKIIQFLAFNVLGEFRAREKEFNLYFSAFFFTPKRENPGDITPFKANAVM